MQVIEIWLTCSTTLPEKIFRNNFIWMFDGFVIAIKKFPHAFPMGKS